VAHVDLHVVAEPPGSDVDVLVTARAYDAASGRLLGEMEARHAPGGWELAGPVGDPEPTVLGQVLGELLAACGAQWPGKVCWWVKAVDDATHATAAAVGLVPERELLQMRRPLPVGEDVTLETRPFVVGDDEAAWLEVNNAAFSWHEDQSDWSLADIQAREREPWFDPAGFVLTEVDGRLAGFCWTKVHDATEPRLGEIYVIAVHPDFHGRGLGRALTLAGLDHLAGRGLEVGMLYVEADNTAARSLYEDLGFTVHHRDRRYERAVP
jgi:mycothiol synthase